MLEPKPSGAEEVLGGSHGKTLLTRGRQALKTNHLFHGFTLGLSYRVWKFTQTAPSSLHHCLYIHCMDVKYL